MLGRNYALTHFSTKTCLPKVIEVLEKAISGKRRDSCKTELLQGRRA